MKNISLIIEAMDLEVLTDVYTDKTVKDGYCCDMLSYVMSHLSSESVWFTILNSINVIAVATLTECPLVVLTEGVTLPDDVLAKAKEEKIVVCSTTLTTYEAASTLGMVFMTEEV
ncbi:MAG TPA: DRTGG domain-containing protein [Bacillota bacterium]|nr:DRTGG domain-containing protein [Bacillota bacterium]HPE39053.1 DRTGG domain-containing protein [Bacillota bacterium]